MSDKSKSEVTGGFEEGRHVRLAARWSRALKVRGLLGNHSRPIGAIMKLTKGASDPGASCSVPRLGR